MTSVYFFLRMRSVVSVLPKKLTMTLYLYPSVHLSPVLLFFALCLQPTCGEILQGPVSQLAPLNSKATFFCRASGDLVIWYINGDPVDYRNQGSLRQRGFTFADINVPPEVNKTMSVTASLQNNNTNINCGTALGQGQSATAILLVAGVPSIPHPQVTIVNKTTLQISWEKPFTMGPFTVHNYSLSVVNSSSHSLIISRNITTKNVTAYTELFSIPHAGQACSELEIKLTATNVIGESGVGTTTGGFPVSPGSLESLDSEVTFQPDGTPQVEIRFMFPYICSYQEANYTIVVLEESTSNNFEEGPFEYVDRDEHHVRTEIQNGLRPNLNYTATVIVETVAGSINSSISFNTIFTPPTPDTLDTLGSLPPAIGGTSGSSFSLPPAFGGTPGSSLSLPPAIGGVDHQQDGSNTTVIIGAAVGSIVFILLVAICVVAACIITRRKRGKDVQAVDPVRKACSSMVPNPIYESDNHLYEEIHLKQQQPSSQNRDSGYVDITLNIASQMKLKSERDTTPQEIVGYENVDLKVPTSTDGDYTLMNPVGTIRSTQQTEKGVGEERHQPCNNMPFETDTNRYVIS